MRSLKIISVLCLSTCLAGVVAAAAAPSHDQERIWKWFTGSAVRDSPWFESKTFREEIETCAVKYGAAATLKVSPINEERLIRVTLSDLRPSLGQVRANVEIVLYGFADDEQYLGVFGRAEGQVQNGTITANISDELMCIPAEGLGQAEFREKLRKLVVGCSQVGFTRAGGSPYVFLGGRFIDVADGGVAASLQPKPIGNGGTSRTFRQVADLYADWPCPKANEEGKEADWGLWAKVSFALFQYSGVPLQWNADTLEWDHSDTRYQDGRRSMMGKDRLSAGGNDFDTQVTGPGWIVVRGGYNVPTIYWNPPPGYRKENYRTTVGLKFLRKAPGLTDNATVEVYAIEDRRKERVVALNANATTVEIICDGLPWVVITGGVVGVRMRVEEAR